MELCEAYYIWEHIKSKVLPLSPETHYIKITSTKDQRLHMLEAVSSGGYPKTHTSVIMSSVFDDMILVSKLLHSKFGYHIERERSKNVSDFYVGLNRHYASNG